MACDSTHFHFRRGAVDSQSGEDDFWLSVCRRKRHKTAIQTRAERVLAISSPIE